MSLSIIGSASAAASSVTFSAPNSGDLIVVWAHRDGNTTAPTLPVDWYALENAGANSNSARLGYKYSNGTETTTGTWTNATSIAVIILRSSTGRPILPGAYAQGGTATTTLSIPALTLGVPDGSSWVIGFGASQAATDVGSTNPTGMTLVTNPVSNPDIAIWSTGGGVSSWSAQSVTINSSTGNRAASLELIEPVAPLSPDLLVQHVSSATNVPGVQGQPGNNFKLPLPNAVGAGNCLVLAITYPTGATPTSVTDNINGTWPARTAFATGSSFDSSIYVFPNSGSGVMTVTVNFSTTQSPFQYNLSEFCRIATTSSAAGSSSVADDAAPLISCGSYTPTNNNATGGNLIYSYFCLSASASSHLSQFVPIAGLHLIHADIHVTTDQQIPDCCAWGFQSTSAAIDPSVFASGDVTADVYNGVSIALKYDSSAGTPAPSSGIRIRRINAMARPPFSGATTFRIQCPTVGNLIILHSNETESLTLDSVTDNKGNIYTEVGTTLRPQYWYAENASPDENLVITCHVTSGGAVHTIWMYDIERAATSSVLGTSSGVDPTDVSNQSNISHQPDITPTEANGLIITHVDLGFGPALGFFTGAPSGAFWETCSYTGQTDDDLMNNGAGLAHLYNTDTSALTWNWTITPLAGNFASSTAVFFRAEPNVAVIMERKMFVFIY